MRRSPLLLRIWAILIAALGAWYVKGWTGAALEARDSFSLAVGIFCIIAGLLTFFISFKMNRN